MPDAATGWRSCRLGLGGPGRRSQVLRGLRDGGSPWLIHAGGRPGVLRVPVPRCRSRTYSATTWRSGPGKGWCSPPACREQAIPRRQDPEPERLRALGAAAARISSVTITPTPALPARSRPIEVDDFPGMRRDQGTSDLLRAAEKAVAATRPGDARTGLVHGDLWHDNTLWHDGKLTAVLDWDCAGVGPAGIDLGSLRCDAAWCHGIDAAAHVLDGWQAEACRPASDIAYWDAVAALASPPDMGWFPQSMTLQCRPDLTRKVLLERRDSFLAAALNQLAAAS